MLDSATRAGLMSVLGASLGVLITPFMAGVWTYEVGVVWADKPLVERVFGPTLESWGALTFGPDGFPYEVYGKAFVFVYLSMLMIVRHVHVLQSIATESKWERRVWSVLWVALIVATVGDGVSYWGISAPEPVGQFLWQFGFGIEILAMLVVLLATTAYGLVSMRIRVLPIWAAGLLTVVVPIGVATLASVTPYVPNAVVVPMSISWAMIGVWVLIRHTRQPTVGLDAVANGAT